MSCPFCNFDDPTVTVYEDEHVRAFVSLAPINNWHLIVTPRTHYERFTDIPTATALAVTMVAQKLAGTLATVSEAAGMTIITEDDYENLGLNLVAHWKLHLIARFKGDAVRLEWSRGNEPPLVKRATIAAALRAHLPGSVRGVAQSF